MISSILPVGEWLPDQQDFLSGGCTVATNVLTNGEGYLPFPSFAASTDALAAQCYGGYSHIASNGTVTVFAATRTKIYRLDGTSWTDVTNTGGDYTTPLTGAWQFTQYGDTVIATNGTDKIQKYLVGTDTEFSDLITSGPDVICNNFGVINNFLVGVNIIDTDGTTKNRVRWSPINDPGGDWSSSQSTQSDYQNVEDGNPGEGMAVISGQNYGILVFKNAIYRMEYVGPPSIFQFSLVENTRGAVHPNLVASNGELIFYYSETGVWLFDGNRSIPIGHQKVDEYLKADVDDTKTYQARCTVSPTDKVFLMSYTSNSSPDGYNDKTLIYSWADNRFTILNVSVDYLFRSFTATTTLDSIEATYPDLDAIPFSFDSRFWAGGQTQLSGVNSDNEFGNFDGSALTALLEAQEMRFNEDGTAYVESVLPVHEAGTAQVRLGSRNLLNNSVNYTPYQSPSTQTGEVNFEDESRYHRVGVQLSGDWSHFKGFRIRSKAGGGV